MYIRNIISTYISSSNNSIFTTQATSSSASFHPPELQYDRLAEKLRFVSMQPIVDSPILPSKLCWTCIVQLNLAYNFKNVAIETHIYLERHNIENGLVGAPPTPSMSTAATAEEEEDEDSHSLLSSISRRPPQQCQTIMPLRQPPSTVSTNTLTTMTDSSPVSQTSRPSQAPSSGEDFYMLDASQIKREVEDEATRIFCEVLDLEQSNYLKELATSTTKRKAVATAASCLSPSKRSNNKARQRSPTKTKMPMVAVHRILEKASEEDRQYLDKILRTKDTRSSEVGQPTRESLPHEAYSSYDLNNSKMLRELLNNLPKSRLRRSRRTST